MQNAKLHITGTFLIISLSAREKLFAPLTKPASESLPSITKPSVDQSLSQFSPVLNFQTRFFLAGVPTETIALPASPSVLYFLCLQSYSLQLP